MKFFTIHSFTIGLILIFTQHSSSLFSMEEEKSTPKEIPGTVSWHSAAPKKGHRRKRSTSAFSRFENDGEELSISSPRIVSDRRSTSSPEQRKNKSASHIVAPRKRSDAVLTPFKKETKQTDKQPQSSSEILTKLKQICIDGKQTPDQTKRADEIIASFAKLSLLKKRLKKSKYLLCINHCGKKGEPPLHRAIRSSQVVIVQLLLEAGAEINCQDTKGVTALHKLFNMYYAGNEWSEMYNEFLKCKEKLKPNVPNFAGEKVFYSVLLSDMYDQVKYLTELDADVTLPTTLEENSTPMALLKALELSDEIKKLLVDKGAKETDQKHTSKARPKKTRNRKKSRESIATLRRHAQSNLIPNELSEAIQTLLQEHDNNPDEEECEVFHDLPISEKRRIRREISTTGFNKEKLQKFTAQFTEQKDGKPHETFDSMPVTGDPAKDRLFVREASSSDLGQRKKRGQTVYHFLPTPEDSEEEKVEGELIIMGPVVISKGS